MMNYQFQPFQDEHVYSWLCRLYKLSAQRNPKQFLVKHNINSRYFLAQSAVENASAQLLAGISCSERRKETLLNHTSLSLWGISVNQEKFRAVKEQLLSNSVNEKFHMNEQVLFGFNRNWKFCKKCVDADVEQYGTSYWHLKHQLPSIILCYKHLSVLMSSQAPHTNLNTLTLPCEIETGVPVALNIHSDVIKWQGFVLQYFDKFNCDQMLAGKLRQQIESKLAKHNKYRSTLARWCDVHTASFEATLGKPILKHLFRIYLNEKVKSPNILHKFIAPQKDKNEVRNPIYWLALVYWLSEELPEKIFELDHDLYSIPQAS